MTAAALTPGDPAPWFQAATLAGTEHHLGVLGGRWVALYFAQALQDDHATRLLADLIAARGRWFNDDHLVFFAVLTQMPPPPVAAAFAQASHKGLGFMLDESGAITRQYGADAAPRLVVLDPLLRVAAIYSVGTGGATFDAINDYVGMLPPVDDFAAVPITAPALIVPHVFEDDFCTHLIDLYDANGGHDSGFMRDSGGKTMTMIDHAMKRRSDFPLEDDQIRVQVRMRVARRVVPMIERFFQYRPTRMDRYLVSCYEAESGGHFARHRDNVNEGARHRRFAASFNLNGDYDGCDLIFPEFGRRRYRAPPGGVIVFSTGALHQVTPITRGKRYAFVPFFYGEEEARQRLHNNARLHDGEAAYTGDRDRLFP